MDLIDFDTTIAGAEPRKLSILDIGCGSGELTRQLASMENVESVLGMDLDPSMIDKAASQAQNENRSSKASFQIGDIRSFRPPKPFDVVFSNAALHWIPPKDMERAVQSIAASLQPGGQLVLEMGGKGNVAALVDATLQIVPNAKCPWCFPSVGEMSSLLEKYGVEVLSAELFDRPTKLEDGARGATNWLRMFGAAFFEGLSSDEEIETALTRINKVLLSTHPELFDGECWTADYRRLRIVARKSE